MRRLAARRCTGGFTHYLLSHPNLFVKNIHLLVEPLLSHEHTGAPLVAGLLRSHLRSEGVSLSVCLCTAT